jgi:hypothetical protein
VLGHGFPETQTVLDLRQPFDPPTAPISALVTSEDFKSFFATWKEGTSTSPSGKHLGHHKALLSPAFADDDRLTASANRIIEAHVTLLNIAASHGRPMERWKQIVSVMIEKKAGNCQLNKLRTMQLPSWHDLRPPYGAWRPHGAWRREARPSPGGTMGLQTDPPTMPFFIRS